MSSGSSGASDRDDEVPYRGHVEDDDQDGAPESPVDNASGWDVSRREDDGEAESEYYESDRDGNHVGESAAARSPDQDALSDEHDAEGGGGRMRYSGQGDAGEGGGHYAGDDDSEASREEHLHQNDAAGDYEGDGQRRQDQSEYSDDVDDRREQASEGRYGRGGDRGSDGQRDYYAQQSAGEDDDDHSRDGLVPDEGSPLQNGREEVEEGEEPDGYDSQRGGREGDMEMEDVPNDVEPDREYEAENGIQEMEHEEQGEDHYDDNVQLDADGEPVRGMSYDGAADEMGSREVSDAESDERRGDSHPTHPGDEHTEERSPGRARSHLSESPSRRGSPKRPRSPLSDRVEDAAEANAKVVSSPGTGDHIASPSRRPKRVRRRPQRWEGSPVGSGSKAKKTSAQSGHSGVSRDVALHDAGADGPRGMSNGDVLDDGGSGAIKEYADIVVAPRTPSPDPVSTASVRSAESGSPPPEVVDSMDAMHSVMRSLRSRPTKQMVVEDFQAWQLKAISNEATYQKALHNHLRRQLRKRLMKVLERDRVEDEALRNACSKPPSGDGDDEESLAAERKAQQMKHLDPGLGIIPERVRLPLEAYFPKRVCKAKLCMSLEGLIDQLPAGPVDADGNEVVPSIWVRPPDPQVEEGENVGDDAGSAEKNGSPPGSPQ